MIPGLQSYTTGLLKHFQNNTLSELEFKLLIYNYVVELNERHKFVIISLAGL